MQCYCWWVGASGSCCPPENKEGAAGRFPFVAGCDKQGLIRQSAACRGDHSLRPGRDGRADWREFLGGDQLGQTASSTGCQCVGGKLSE